MKKGSWASIENNLFLLNLTLNPNNLNHQKIKRFIKVINNRYI